jgi:regulator of cell morphogenesis and NO signaling
MTTSATLAEIAATSLSAVRLLEHHGLDYCCGGKQPFDQACRARNIAPDALLREIQDAKAARGQEVDWQTAPIGDLIKHILGTHHEYLKLELPALGQRMSKVLSAHGERDPETLPRLAEVFAALRAELEMHLHKEEAILFPFIEEYGRAELQGRPVPPVPFGSIRRPIAMMEQEHAGAGDALVELRRLTRDYELPPYACGTVQALYQGLQALEGDLHTHIHLENNILFPRAVALERR